jgi:hypothetical protein
MSASMIFSGDYLNFQTPRVFENPWGLEIRCVFEMWVITSFLKRSSRENFAAKM